MSGTERLLSHYQQIFSTTWSRKRGLFVIRGLPGEGEKGRKHVKRKNDERIGGEIERRLGRRGWGNSRHSRQEKG